MIVSVNLGLNNPRESEVSFFEIKAVLALGISVTADALDYAAAPIFALPVIGDITDLIVTGLLYRLTKSKVSVVINAVEFIPFIGDFIPTYTISTTLWILNMLRKRGAIRDREERKEGSTQMTSIAKIDHNESLRTRIWRAYSILRSRATPPISS